MNRNKLLDMIRSILPSRHRIGPRWAKAARKRAHRRSVRTDIRFHNEAADLLRDVRVSDIVQWRRGGDKLAHFLRWCDAIAAGMSVEEALSHVRAILPRTLIGDHAYSHWEGHVRHRGRRFGRYRDVVARREQSYHDSAAFRLRRALCVDPSLHARLNAEIKAYKKFDEPRRLLGGLHDVEAFVHDVRERTPDPHYGERTTMLRLIGEVEKGGREAALPVRGVRVCRRAVSWRASRPPTSRC